MKPRFYVDGFPVFIRRRTYGVNGPDGWGSTTYYWPSVGLPDGRCDDIGDPYPDRIDRKQIRHTVMQYLINELGDEYTPGQYNSKARGYFTANYGPDAKLPDNHPLYGRYHKMLKRYEQKAGAL